MIPGDLKLRISDLNEPCIKALHGPWRSKIRNVRSQRTRYKGFLGGRECVRPQWIQQFVSGKVCMQEFKAPGSGRNVKAFHPDRKDSVSEKKRGSAKGRDDLRYYRCELFGHTLHERVYKKTSRRWYTGQQPETKSGRRSGCWRDARSSFLAADQWTDAYLPL